MNVHFPKGSVEETLLLPLYAKAWCAQHFPDIFADRECVDILNRLGHDFSDIERKNPKFLKIAALAAGVRQYAIATELRRFVEKNPDATIVNLGCGLDTTGHLVDTGRNRFINLDLHDVILVREELLPSGEREQNRAADISLFEGLDSWFDIIDESKHNALVFFACGVFLYLKKETVLSLLAAMAEHFSGARLIFDAQNAMGARFDLKTLAKAGINVSTNFSLNRPEEELRSVSKLICQVRTHGMSAGYLKPDPRFGIIFALLAHLADFTRMSQINILDFA